MDERAQRMWEDLFNQMAREQECVVPPSVRVMPDTFVGLNPGELFQPHAYYGIGNSILDQPKPNQEVSNMKFEEITQGLPIMGLRVMINPEKFEEFPRSLHGMSGTIINVQGSHSGCQNIINTYKDQGHINNKSWNVTVKFENGKQHDIQVRKLIPINNNHQDIHHIYTNHDDRERYLFDAEYEDYIAKRVIMNGEKILHDKLYNDEYRRKIFDEA